MGKKMCKDEAAIRKKRDDKPGFVCKSCGAKAVKEKHLCKPKKKQ